jgi:glycosyltransferase involved in cell wall biosynthesis
MVTPGGKMDPAVARRTATTPRPAQEGGNRGHRRMGVLRDLAKDFRDFVRAIGFAATASRAVPRGTAASMVWQHHEPWQWSGWLLARRCRAPWVLFVDAPVVWESRAWGVRRPGWGAALERLGEVPQLRRADVVACVSETVADEVRRLGAPSCRVIVTPCSVDPSEFTTARHQALDTRRELDLEGRLVVGWLGSFRRFHGIPLLLHGYEAAKKEHPELALLLVGDGAERSKVQEEVRNRELSDIVFTGMVPHDDVPRHLAAMDIGVVIDPGSTQWHYSPLKLREYMATGLAIVAPRSGQVSETIRHGHEALLVDPGDAHALASAFCELASDASLRSRLGSGARARSEADGGWDQQLEAALSVVQAGHG